MTDLEILELHTQSQSIDISSIQSQKLKEVEFWSDVLLRI